MPNFVVLTPRSPSYIFSSFRYVDYIRHLWTSRPPLDETQAFESPFYDYLQIPLQPLADNLESNTCCPHP